MFGADNVVLSATFGVKPATKATGSATSLVVDGEPDTPQLFQFVVHEERKKVQREDYRTVLKKDSKP